MSHPTFRRKPSANLYACQDQVSCILWHISEYRNNITWKRKITRVSCLLPRCIRVSLLSKLLGFTRSTFVSHICSTDSIPWVHHSREEGSLDYELWYNY
jgi:hypothetical protein